MITRDNALERPTLMRYDGKFLQVDIKEITHDVVWFTMMTWKGERPHKVKIYDGDSDPWFQIDGHKIFLRSCTVKITSTDGMVGCYNININKIL